MRNRGIALALVINLICPFAFAQWVPTSGLSDRQGPHHPWIDTNLSRDTPCEFLGLPTQHRMHAEFMPCFDSLRASRMPLALSDERLIRNAIQEGSCPLRRMSLPQSPIYVVDTAIVRSTSNTTRHLYTYNSSGSRTFGLTQSLRGGLWADSMRENNTYDANSNMLSHKEELWSGAQWLNAFRIRYAYDIGGKLLTQLIDNWLTGQWVTTQRFTYTHDMAGNMLIELGEGWANNQLVNNYRYTYTYDANGNMLTWLQEDWSNGQWANVYHYTYTYDGNGRRRTDLFALWLSGAWAEGARTTYTYDVYGRMIAELGERKSYGSWVYNLRRTYTYGPYGVLVTELSESWSGQWVNGVRLTYTYNANGKRLVELWEDWLNGQWVNDLRYSYTYEVHGNMTSLSFDSWLSSSWTPSDESWNIVDSAGNNSNYYGYNVNLFYNTTMTGIPSDIGDVTASCSLQQNYPNPFNPSTIIRFELPKSSVVKLSVCDLLGREVAVLVNERRNTGVHEVKFNGSNLASGVYFYRLQAEEFVATKRLLLLK